MSGGEKFSEMFFNPSKKEQKVNGVFSSVFNKYDAMNDISSLALHRLWKKTFANSIVVNDNTDILDVSTGSGDIANLLLKKARHKNIKIHLTLSDYNENMLSLAKKRFDGVIDNNNFLVLDACKLSHQTQKKFDIITCSFGVRNFYNVNEGLGQIYKTLKTEGAFYCLEFSPLEKGLFKSLYSKYSNNILPFLGQKIAGDGEAYKYLASSIDNFLKPEQFLTQMRQIGYKNCFYTNIFGGLVAMYYGSK